MRHSQVPINGKDFGLVDQEHGHQCTLVVLESGCKMACMSVMFVSVCIATFSVFFCQACVSRVCVWCNV